MIETVRSLIVNLRRGIDTEASLRAFRKLVEEDTAAVCESLNTRWLVSVCDTYVDHGDAVEKRNAMLVSLLVNTEKIGQSYLNWRVNYEKPYVVPADHEPRKIRLWDGMTSMHIDCGDVTNNLFRRLEPLLKVTPHIHAIYTVILKRIAHGPTILASLDAHHRHVFESDIKWRDAPEYDKWREEGTLPPRRGA